MIIKTQDLLKKSLNGKVVIFPTDTVYGIGCPYFDEEAIERVYAIKKRDGSKPLAILCGSMQQVKLLADNYHDFKDLAIKHWPGALTLVVKKNQNVPDSITKGLDTVGLRIPDDENARALLNHFGPMAVTSLNISSEPPITTFEAAKAFEAQVDYLVEGSDTTNMSSTVYDTINHVVLREGIIKIDSEK